MESAVYVNINEKGLFNPNTKHDYKVGQHVLADKTLIGLAEKKYKNDDGLHLVEFCDDDAEAGTMNAAKESVDISDKNDEIKILKAKVEIKDEKIKTLESKVQQLSKSKGK